MKIDTRHSLNEALEEAPSTAREAVKTNVPTRTLPPPPDFNRPVYCLLGLPIDSISMERAVQRIRSAAWLQRRCFLSTPNLNFLVKSRHNAAFRDSILQSDLCVADGMPLVWIAAGLDIPIRERIAGSTLFERISRISHRQLGVYFFGGPDGIAAQAATSLNAASAGATCVGYSSPGFGSVDDMSTPMMIDNINATRPDFLVVALGVEKGHAWIRRNFSSLQAPVISHLGAVVNIIAGKISRAPQWIQDVGLEWLWRIKEEPTLWKRYASDGAVMLQMIVMHLLPAMYYQRRTAISHARFLASTTHIDFHGGACTVTLKGPWNEVNLSGLRKALAAATLVPCPIYLDLNDVDYLDSATLGLFCLLKGYQNAIGFPMQIIGTGRRVENIFRAHCAAYLLDSEKSLE